MVFFFILQIIIKKELGFAVINQDFPINVDLIGYFD
jgi:hypothetical protein